YRIDLMFISALSRLRMMLQATRFSSLLTAFVFVVSLSGAASIASAQIKRQKPPATEAEEYYDDPPARFPATGLSPGMISIFDGFMSYQVNVNASGMNITGDAANECSIAVDPTNRNKKVIGWRQ